MPSPSQAFTTTRATSVRFFLALSLAFSAAVSSLLVASPVIAQTPTSIADYVPDSVLMYAEFELDKDSDQVALASELVERTNLASLLSDEDVATVEDTVDTLSLVVDGEAAVFVTELPLDKLLETTETISETTDLGTDPLEALSEDIPAGWAVVLHPSDAEEAFSFYESLVFGDAEVATTDSAHGGFDIESSVPEDEFTSPMSMALVDDVIVLASVPDDIFPVIDAVNGDVDVLSQSDSFSEVRGAFADDLLSFAYINGPALLKQLIVSGGENAIDALESQGTSFAFYQGMAVWAEHAGFRIDTASLPIDLAELPDAVIYDNTFAESASADALVFSGGTNLGTNPGVEAAALLLAQGVIAEQAGIDVLSTPMALDPETNAQIVFARAEAALGFNIQTDVLDALSGEWSATVSADNLLGSTPEFSALFMSEVTDEDSINDVLGLLTEQIESAAEEAHEDVTIATVSSGGANITIISFDDSDFPLSIAYGVIENKLVISLNQSLEDGLVAPAESLAENEVFVQTFEALPQDNLTSVSYINVSQLFPMLEGLLTMTSTSSTSADDDPDCGNYESQTEAQSAYDEDSFELWNLDLDFDGEACEDFFATDSPATPVASGTSEFGLLSIGTVTYSDGNIIGSSTIILIAD